VRGRALHKSHESHRSHLIVEPKMLLYLHRTNPDLRRICVISEISG
jgi:hypothetical protein